MPKPFYITTTLPYINAEPHIGFGAEIIRADIIARFHKLAGEEVFFNTGTDEHGQKIYQKALELNLEPQAYADKLAEKFRDLIKPLGISEDVNFVRTTDKQHIEAAQEFWRRCHKAGDIYKKQYKIKYCVGCELEKTESELENDKCPLHPNREIEIREEENYFFKFSRFQEILLDLYRKNPEFVLPASRQKEITAFVERGLEDFSISRLASKMPWGIPVPDDAEHIMYVWFDALVNYVSVLGWPKDEARFKKWWLDTDGAVQYCGKDNLRQQTAMWQAMLLSAGLPPSKKVAVCGFINSNGQKMSKSLGNVVNPLDIVAEYGTEALRYFVARELVQFEDSDFTKERFLETYNANLANGLGNLVSRIMKMAETNLEQGQVFGDDNLPEEYELCLGKMDINKASDLIWEKISGLDRRIQLEQPFKIIKESPEAGRMVIAELVADLYSVAKMLAPILPTTSEKILNLIKENKMPDTPLFIRK